MRKHIATTLVFATLALAGCGSSQDSESKTGSDSLATTQTTTSVDLAASTTIAPTADTTTLPTTAPAQTVASTVAPKAPVSTTAPKASTSTRVPQMQLTGTPEEQLSQVVAATEKVAVFPLSSSQWASARRQLNDSLVSYGIKVKWDPNGEGLDIYQISMGGQSACFLWETVPGTSNEGSLKPHSCS
jgi:hypothetical protein